jgi:hypothetical protein
VIGWLPHSTNPIYAGVRYRCLYPMRYLCAEGIPTEFFQAGHIGRYRSVVLQELLSLPDSRKPYPTGAGILELMKGVKKHGARIVLDVCDNHFHYGRSSAQWTLANDVFRRMADMADDFVFSTDELAAQMRNHLGARGAYRVIGDLVEADDVIDDASLLRRWLSPRRARARAAEVRVRASVAAARRRGAANLVWFGAAGTPLAAVGMDSLRRVREILEETARSVRPLELTIISNNRRKYDSITRDWQIPTRFVVWDINTFMRILRVHDVCIIPIERNPFTNCKSNNRILTALRCGLPVVADSIPSYLEFADCVAFDDWRWGLNRYLTEPGLAKRDVLRGQQRIARTWSRELIGRRWLELLIEPRDAVRDAQVRGGGASGVGLRLPG